jgi:hypothetical protein
VQTKVKKIFIVIKHENINIKRTKHNYRTKSYLKLMLNKLKVMRDVTSIYKPLGNNSRKLSWRILCA